jgi:ABC-2 type transport system ATP-binding protein
LHIHHGLLVGRLLLDKAYFYKMQSPIIVVRDLVKNYGDFQAVKGISFEVRQGEIFGLLGPNGAGKTSTLEIIETLRAKTSGEVWVDGKNLDTAPNEIKQVIGVQLQAAGYYPNLNLKQLINLFAGLYNRNVDPMQLLDTVNLREKTANKYKELSGGQKQRFSIATTLINEPKVIFLDEPSTGLDPQARRNLWGLIRQVCSRGATIVLTTHDMDEAEELCDRLAIIDRGRIIAMDTPEMLVDNLLASGFKREKELKGAKLEDVFLNLTGREMREA